jgi:hypothetical protein
MSQKLFITAMQFPNKLAYIPTGSMWVNARFEGYDMRNTKYIHRCSVRQFGGALITVVSTAVQTTISVIFMSRFKLCTAYCTYTAPWLFPHKTAYSFLVYVKLLTCSFRPFSALLAVMPPKISNQGYKTWESLRSSQLFCHFHTALGPQDVIPSSCHLRVSHTYKPTDEINFSINFEFFCLSLSAFLFQQTSDT